MKQTNRIVLLTSAMMLAGVWAWLDTYSAATTPPPTLTSGCFDDVRGSCTIDETEYTSD